MNADTEALDAAVRAGGRALAARERAGAYEGEMRWCPMLAAQFVILHRLLGRELDPPRARRARRFFERSRLPDGTWGLHDHAGPSLYVTTLVYVASRLLGTPADAVLLAPARALFARERVERIPTWGRVWLAMLGIHPWDGVIPMPPELWSMPEALPIHPSRYYPHTRMIYLALSVLRTEARRLARGADLDAIQRELHDGRDVATIDFRAHRFDVSALDLVAPMPRPVQLALDLLGGVERAVPSAVRRAVRRDLRARIRYELCTTDFLGISPVSGMLGLLALRAEDRTDPVIERTIAALETWVFEDEEDGLRVTGARSQTWDTSFALQAHAATGALGTDIASLRRSARWLAAQQIRAPLRDHARFHRVDPVGGFCFAHREHGWPVSDCTAEAVVALLGVEDATISPHVFVDAARFILRCQNHDGGFGSYEPRRVRGSIDFLNPSEMFLECMTEGSYVECTASSLMALVEIRARFPALAHSLDAPIARAVRFLREVQRPDGSFTAAWGIHFVYGTMFGIRALRASGAASDDPAVARAVAFLRRVQRADGGFGEHESSAIQDRFIDLGQSHPVQTSWALLALVESGAPEASESVVRATRYLLDAQDDDGTWPSPRMVGCFFRTSLVDYTLYRVYFPVWALGAALHAQRNVERERTPRPEPLDLASATPALALPPRSHA